MNDFPGTPAPVQQANTTPVVVEVIGGLFGFLGIGWIMANRLNNGIIILVGFLAWNVVAAILDVVTVGFFACLHLPVNIAAVVFSAIKLNNLINPKA